MSSRKSSAVERNEQHICVLFNSRGRAPYFLLENDEMKRINFFYPKVKLSMNRVTNFWAFLWSRKNFIRVNEKSTSGSWYVEFPWFLQILL